MMFVRQRELKPGDFEYESFKTLEAADTRWSGLTQRDPGNVSRHGIRNSIWMGFWSGAGYAESGRVVATLSTRKIARR